MGLPWSPTFFGIGSVVGPIPGSPPPPHSVSPITWAPCEYPRRTIWLFGHSFTSVVSSLVRTSVPSADDLSYGNIRAGYSSASRFVSGCLAAMAAATRPILPSPGFSLVPRADIMWTRGHLGRFEEGSAKVKLIVNRSRTMVLRAPMARDRRLCASRYNAGPERRNKAVRISTD